MDPLQRQLAKSPIHFREGRRASDGLMAQGPFQQRLYVKIKAHGVIELHDVNEECRALQTRVGQLSSSAGNSRSGTPEAQISAAKRPSSASLSSRPSISKRISVPENFTYFPTTPGTNTAKLLGQQVTTSVTRFWTKKKHNLYKSCPKSSNSSLYIKQSVFKLAKNHQMFGLLFLENLLSRTLKNLVTLLMTL